MQPSVLKIYGAVVSGFTIQTKNGLTKFIGNSSTLNSSFSVFQNDKR
jgi:hypothetical protein